MGKKKKKKKTKFNLISLFLIKKQIKGKSIKVKSYLESKA